MPRTKGSKNKVKTVPTTDFAALIAEKAAAKENLTAEVATLEENLNTIKADLKAKKAELKNVSNLSIFEHFCHPIFAHKSIKKAAEAAVCNI